MSLKFSKFYKKFIAAIVALLMSAGIIATPAKPDGGIKADASIAFSNGEAGSAAGTVTVTSNYDGNYSIF